MSYPTKWLRVAAALTSLSCLDAGRAFCATLKANPANIQTVLAGAQGGDRIVLAGGGYSEVAVYNLNPAKAITIDARLATIRYMPFQNSSNLTLLGGAFGPSKYGTVTMLNSHDITLQGGAFTNPGTVGVSVTGSRRINIVGVVITGTRGDGVDIAASQYVLVQNSTCLNNVVTGLHPDCVQMWSIAGQPQVSHITITGNRARGHTQGFDLFDHGTGGGSFIDIDRNVICTTYGWASQLNAVTNSRMTNNVAYTMTGAVPGWQPPTWQIDGATPGVEDGSRNVLTNNKNGVPPTVKTVYPPCPI